MSRFKRRARRDSGLPNKRDTPVKTALSRRGNFKRFLPNKHYETLPEEPDGREINGRPTKPVLAGVTPVRCRSALRSSSPALAEKPRGKAVWPAAAADGVSGHQASPAGHTPDAGAFKGGEVQAANCRAATLESISSPCMESDTTFSSFDDDDEEEEECYSSSSSLPSPEIFRKENYVETPTFTVHEELPALHLHVKNSTLLDASHAESIHMHHLPNLSTIIDASSILAENNCELNQHRGAETETKTCNDSSKSDKTFKLKTTPKLTNRRPILCKKKVWFKSPMTVETCEAKHTPAAKSTIHDAGEPVQTSSLAEQMKLNADTSRAGEVSPKEASPLTVRLKKSVNGNPQKAKFFDFTSDGDRDAFFQRMRERCAKLRGAPLFPLTAANTETLLSSRQNTVFKDVGLLS
uniref:uncharacterized protein LOC124070219 n=1 Tax=Scatophagus argus TaxID=75038 RepID=UPI001ED833F5|nr:uncharacterized protein LOC124070219 [Scatophagus argus]